jgi:Holliday junction DNA helicase RuvB
MDERPLGHVLFMGPSGYGKTTLAQLAAQQLGSRCIILTSYALAKPADLLSLLPTLQSGDVLFVDEIHRLKPVMEEMLYIAMEDLRMDMLMPDGTHTHIPLQPFTLIGATTQSSKLTTPLKNRFVYHCHLEPYSTSEIEQIINFHLRQLQVESHESIIPLMREYMDTTPRSIKNACIALRDRKQSSDHS